MNSFNTCEIYWNKGGITMYNINRRQYILKMSSGRYINIFFKPNAGLCCSELTANNAWTSPSIILKNALPGFSACLDTSDNIHLLCQDENSNLVYIRYKDGSWLSKLISRSKNEKLPCILNPGKKVYLFYVVETSEKNLLVCQTFSEGYLTFPKPIGYVRRSSKPYTIVNGKSGTVHLFYPSPMENTLCCKTLNADTDEWSDPVNINIGMNLSRTQILSVFRDQTGDFHLSLQETNVHKYELIYLRIPAGQETPYNEAVLSSSPYNFLNSSLLVLNKKIIIYWVREDNIIYCVSVDNGNSWSKPEKLGSFNIQLFHCTRFYSNDPKNNIDTINNDIPAMFSDGFQPAFINEFKANDVEIFETADYSTVKIIANIEEINRMANKTDNAIKKLEDKIHIFTSNYNKFIIGQLQNDNDIVILNSKLELLKSI
jgi:hypothetical protein